MTGPFIRRGGAPVGYLSELGAVEAGAVIYLRLWNDGPDARARVTGEFTCSFGPEDSSSALSALDQLCDLCARHGRRPIMRYDVACRCLGGDEACFANFVATAAQGDREDAMLIATLLVRPDFAPSLAALAETFGLALKRMSLAMPGDLGSDMASDMGPEKPVTIH